jgi:serine/threonine-protein kinase
MIGKQIAHFQIEARLGSGGMGEVYQARDMRLGRSVAVKMLPEEFARDPERTARLEREAKLLASLNHPNIAALYGLEQADGRHFLIMELVEGDTLAEQIQRGPLPVKDALKIAHQIAEALEAAHEKGIIHRDLKPANVKITPEGKVKVLDFGLAKALEEASPLASSLNTHSPTLSVMATHAGVILGTAGYMSPEQARGHAADARSDIFSFACVLYEMLTGRQTFQGETVTDVIASIVARDPDWRAIPANLHPKTEELIRRCLAKNRKDRWHAIADVRVELETIMADPHGLKLVAAREVPRQPLWRRAIPFATTAVLVAAVAVAATIAVMNSRPSPPAAVTRFPFVLPDGQHFTNGARNLIALSPDGATIVYEANGQLYLRSMGDMDARSIQGTGTSQNAAAPFFSPDGRWVGFQSRAEQRLKKIAITGGAAVTICDLTGSNNLLGPIWNSDDYIYWGQAKGIVRVSANGGKPENLITLKEGEAAHRPQLLPGGDALLFTLAAGDTAVGSENWDKSQIVVQSLKSGDRKVVIPGGSDARYVPTGHIVYALGATVLAVRFDVRKLQTSGPVPIIEGVRRASSAGGGGADAQVAFSNNGSMVYIPGGQAAASDLVLALVDRSGARKPLNIPAGPYSSPRISPDGRRLTVHTDDGKDRIVWIYDLSDASPIHKLTFEGHNESPLWTRDSQRVVFNSDREGDEGLFWQRADGGSAERLAKAEQGIRPQPASWSPDGKVLILSTRTGTGQGISMLSLGADQKPTLVLKAPANNASLSPDGRWLAYHSNESGRNEVYVQPFPPAGEKHQITTTGGTNPLWSPDGKELFFLRGGSAERQITAVDVQTQRGFAFGKITPLPIIGIIAPGPRPYDITPDGKYFVVIVPKSQAALDKAPAEQINVTLNWFEELKQRVAVK